MLLEEAKWLGRHLDDLSPRDLYPMCNLGSASGHYRSVEQPYIDKYLFESARRRNLKVIHVDSKPAAGVDLVGDLTDPNFLSKLSSLSVRSVMCCNLFEHVRDRKKLCDGIASVLKPGGYLIATVPYRFPYHEDPIDTLYRPTVRELASLFPNMQIHKAATIRASRIVYDMDGDYRALVRMLARVALPFYRPQRWRAAMQRLGAIVSGYKITCAILRSPVTTEAQ